MKDKTLMIILIVGIILAACSSADAKRHSRRDSPSPDVYIFSESGKYQNGREYPYGRSKKSRYGERRSVATEDEAQGIVREYYPGKKTHMGKMKNKNQYFEADILDEQGNVIDRVIIDKRSGRIRSAY